MLFVSILEVRSATTAVSDNAMLLMMLQAGRTADDIVIVDTEDSDLVSNQASSTIFQHVESHDTDMRFVLQKLVNTVKSSQREISLLSILS